MPDVRPVSRTMWTRALRESEIERSDLLVLLDLGTYMNGDGDGAYPSVATIAADTGLAEGSVRRSITKARGAGWLERTRRGGRRGDGSVVSSSYRATIPTAHGCAVDDTSAQPCAVEDGPNRAPTTPQPRMSEPQPRTHARQGVPGREIPQEGDAPGEPAARTGTPAGGTSNPREEDPSLVERAGALVPRRYRAEVGPIVDQLVAERGEPAVDQALADVEQTGARFGFPSTLRDDLERRIADRPARAPAPSLPSSTSPAGVSDGDTCPTHEVWPGICGCSTKPAHADVEQQTRNLAGVRHARRRLGPAQPTCRKCGDTRYLGPARQRFACTFCNADGAAPDSACPTCGMSRRLCDCDDQSDDLGRQEAQP